MRDFQKLSNQSSVPQNSAAGPIREGRLCRIANMANGALLDISVGGERNYIIGSPAGTVAIKTWRIIPLGTGYALRTSEDIVIPRYLAPSSDGSDVGKQVTLSTFPVAWDLSGKTDEYEATSHQTPLDVVEEWTCTIRWAFYDKETRVLDLHNGTGTGVYIQPFRQPHHQRCQFWRIQFLDEAPGYTPVVYIPLPNTANNGNGQVPVPNKHKDIGLKSGAKYMLVNAKSKTLVSKTSNDLTTTVGYHLHGEIDQRWEAIDKGIGWAFRNMSNRRFLSIEQEPADSIKVVTSVSDEILWDVQRGEFEEGEGEDVYRLVLKGTDYSVSLAKFGSSADCVDIVLWKTWYGKCQLWKFDSLE